MRFLLGKSSGFDFSVVVEFLSTASDPLPFRMEDSHLETLLKRTFLDVRSLIVICFWVWVALVALRSFTLL